MAHSFISIKKFAEEPYSKILGYPNATNRQIKSRIKELEKLKIKSICLTGPTTIGNLEILGKGYVGIVVLVKRGSKEVALKIRRTDSQRKNMKNEAMLLKLVNSINVGPKIIDVILEGLLFVLELSKSIIVTLLLPTITCFEILLNSP